MPHFVFQQPVRHHLDPGKILQRGRAAALEGRFEDALRDYIWFHDHALEHDRSYYGVRLSFALAYWTDLAEAYPEARAALEQIKQRKDELLSGGTEGRTLFHDIVRINENLNVEADTYRLFRAVEAQSPDFARQCFGAAVEAIVRAGDFERARAYSPEPEEALLRLSSELNERLADREVPRARRQRQQEAFIAIYCNRVRTLLAILEGINSEHTPAARELAVALVDSRTARAVVASSLLASGRK